MEETDEQCAASLSGMTSGGFESICLRLGMVSNSSGEPSSAQSRDFSTAEAKIAPESSDLSRVKNSNHPSGVQATPVQREAEMHKLVTVAARVTAKTQKIK